MDGGEEAWKIKAQTAATATTPRDPESEDTVRAGTPLPSRGNTISSQDPHGALWHEASSHALGTINNDTYEEGEPLNPECVCSVSGDATAAASLSAITKGASRVVAAPAAVHSCVECHSCARQDARNTENAPEGSDLPPVCIARGSTDVSSSYSDQPAAMEPVDQAVACDSITGKPTVNLQAKSQQKEICDSRAENAVAAAVSFGEALAEIVCPTDDGAVAAARDVTVGSFPHERATADANLPPVASGGPEHGDLMLMDQGTTAAVGMASLAAAAVPSATMTYDELESCKQQLQEMKACLDAVWSQKEAFRHANERLSRTVGRLQGQNIVAARQYLAQPLKSTPSKLSPIRGEGLQRMNRRLRTGHSPPQHHVMPSVDSIAGAAPIPAPPARCSARRSAALPVAGCTNLPSSHSSFCSLQRQDSGRFVGELRAGQRGAGPGRKAVKKECSAINLKEFHPAGPMSRFLRPKSGSQTQRDNSSDGDDTSVTGSLGYFPASAGCPPSRLYQVASKYQQSDPSSHNHHYHQERSPVSPFQANTRRSLPPVPRLDLQRVLSSQQRAAVGLVSLTPSAAPDQQTPSGQGRRLSSLLQRSSSNSARSLAAAETTRTPVHSLNAGCSGECESLVGRRDSVTTQDSLCMGKEMGSKKYMRRQTNFRRISVKDGDRCRQSSSEEVDNKRENVVQCGLSPIDSDIQHSLRKREEQVTGRQQVDMRRKKAVLQRRASFYSSSSSRAYQQRSIRKASPRLEAFMPLQSRPVCAAGGLWKPMLSMRCTIGGFAHRGRGYFSARPSLAETAMKTPRTCFLDDRIVRAPQIVKSSVWRDNDSVRLPTHSAAAQDSISQTSFRPKIHHRNVDGHSGRFPGSSQRYPHSVANDEVPGGLLSVEEQLTLHVRHCMEMLQCTDGRREDDPKTAADVSRTSSSAAQAPAAGIMSVGEAEENFGGRVKRTGGLSSPLSLSSSAMASLQGTGVAATEEGSSTLQACVRKPRDGYWHVIYTCVMKVRDTDFFLNVRLAGGTAADGKKYETARLVASKEEAGVFKVCIRHLLRSTRDFFDSARVLWWQPLPVVCSEEWLPYDEVMRARADMQIRALRAKYPALAATADEREKKRVETAEAEEEESTSGRRTPRNSNNRKQQEKQYNSMHGTGVVTGLLRREEAALEGLRSTKSVLYTNSRTACPRHLERSVKQDLCQEEGRSTKTNTPSSCNSSCLYRRGSITERSSNQATPSSTLSSASASLDTKVMTGNEFHRGGGSVSSIAGTGGRGVVPESRLVNDDQANPTPTKENKNKNNKMSESSNVRPSPPLPPRHYSEWDAVGLIYAGSLCAAEQPVAQFKRILGSCNGSLGEHGGLYLTCSKPKPRSMVLSPSSDMSFLLSEPTSRSSSCSSDSRSSSINSDCSSLSSFTCMTRDSEQQSQRGKTPGSFESDDRSSTSKITVISPTHTKEDRNSLRREQEEDLASVLSKTSRSRLPKNKKRTCLLHYDEECINSSITSIKRKDRCCSRSNTTSSSSSSSNISSNRSSCSSTPSTNIKRSGTTGWRGGIIPPCAPPVRQKQSPVLVQQETMESAFDKTCQLSLSRKLGPQELFIVRRSDREKGCFPLYHYFSGRYLCAHATNGLVGMLRANATPTAATAARDVRKEIKTSSILSSAANQAANDVVSQPSAVRRCTVTHGRQPRKNNGCGEKTASPSRDVSSKMIEQHCLPAEDSATIKRFELRRTTNAAANDNTLRGIVLENNGDQKKTKATAGTIGTMHHHTQQWSHNNIAPLTVRAGDSCASAAYFPTSPFFLSRLAHQGKMSSSHEKGNTASCGSDSGYACAPSQSLLQASEPMSMVEKHSTTETADIRESVRAPAETIMRELGRCMEQEDAEWSANGPPEVSSVLHENRRCVSVSASQQGARKLGALEFRKSLKLQRKHHTEQYDTHTLATSSAKPSVTPELTGKSVTGAARNRDADVSGVNLQDKGLNVPRMSYQENASSLVPSLFELVTVSDLLVQQTVARILAAVPQPTVVSCDHQETQDSSADSTHHRVQGRRELVGRTTEEVEVSTQDFGAQRSEERERRSLASESMEQLLAPEDHGAAVTEEAGSPRTERKPKYSKEYRMYRDKGTGHISEDLAEDGICKAAIGKPWGGEYNVAASTRVQNASAASTSRRSRRNSDFTAPEAAITTAESPSRCFTTYTISSRCSLPAKKNTILPRNVPLVLPHAPFNLDASNGERESLTQGSPTRMQRRKSTYGTQTHVLGWVQQQQPKHRQQPRRRPRQSPREKEKVCAIAVPSHHAKAQSLRVRGGCEQFCLDDCDALTEIASDEIPTGQLES